MNVPLALAILGVAVMAAAAVVGVQLIKRGAIGPTIGVVLGCAFFVALMTDAMPGVK